MDSITQYEYQIQWLSSKDTKVEKFIPPSPPTLQTMDQAQINTKVCTFWNWLKETGFKPHPNIELRWQAEDGIGVFVKEGHTIKEGEVLFECPENGLMTERNTGISHVVGQMVADMEKKAKRSGVDVRNAVDSVRSWLPLVFSLLHELATPDSKFKPYCDVLPKYDELTMPLFWTAEQRAWIRGTDLLRSVNEEETQMKHIFKCFKPVIMKYHAEYYSSIPKTAIYDEMCRVFAIVRSYSFTDEHEHGGEGADSDSDSHSDCDHKDKRQRTGTDTEADADATVQTQAHISSSSRCSVIMMIPFADTLNHKTGCNNARLFGLGDDTSDGSGDLKMMTVCDVGVSGNGQLYNTYGDLSNAELLLKYGFCDEANPHDVLFLQENEEDDEDDVIAYLTFDGMLSVDGGESESDDDGGGENKEYFKHKTLVERRLKAYTSTESESEVNDVDASLTSKRRHMAAETLIKGEVNILKKYLALESKL